MGIQKKECILFKDKDSRESGLRKVPAELDFASSVENGVWGPRGP